MTPPPPFSWIQKLDGLIAYIEGVVLVALLGSLGLLSLTDVVLGFFDGGLSWINRFFAFSMLWLGLLGASLATRQGRHINIDLFSRFIPIEKARWGLEIITSLAAAVVCAVFAKQGWTYIFEIEAEGADILFTIAGVGIEHYWQYIVIPAAFAMMGARFLLRSVIGALAIMGLSDPPDDGREVPDQAVDEAVDEAAATGAQGGSAT